MKNVLKTLVILLLLFCFLFLIPSATHVGWAEIIDIPIDAETKLSKVPDAIPLPQESGRISDTEYSDPSISVSFEVRTGPGPDSGCVPDPPVSDAGLL